MTNYADIKDDSILKYEGTVILSIEKNGKIYETFVSHNKGRWPLFYCIAASLAGNYEVADLDRPKFIRLFTSVPSADNNDNEATLIAIPYNTSPSVVYHTANPADPEDEDSATVSFKFLIPGSYLKTVNGISHAALYSKSSDAVNNYLALVEVKDIVSKGLTNENLNNYNLVVTWQLTIKN